MSGENITESEEKATERALTEESVVSEVDSLHKPNFIIFRITGPQSIARLQPLMHQLNMVDRRSNVWISATESSQKLSFVWETTCEKLWRDRHVRHLLLANTKG